MIGKLLTRTSLCLVLAATSLQAQSPATRQAEPGDAPADPGPLAARLSPAIKPAAIEAAMRKVADWQAHRMADTPSQDWTFATLYLGLLSASRTLHDPAYRDLVLGVADHYAWTLGPRKQHADDQAIGQSYLALYREHPDPTRIAPMRAQFDEVMQIPDDPAKPGWWWCDALFMAPPAWAELSEVTHDSRYLDYMHHQWQRTSDLLWDPQEHLFSRDATYLDKHEKNGRKLFWSRGNGWVMGGLAQMLEHLPANDPHRAFYVEKFREMADTVAKIQSPDGLWRPGLLDAADYPEPEISGSAFFVYAITWGVNHGILDRARFEPVAKRGWAGLLQHIYADGRLGDIQPIGAAPGAYTPGASYVYGIGAFLLAGSELDHMARTR
ncbi:glycoside hydrolase family 88/105 protein [Silvibacterium dinghuense]|uniref:Glycoside hydrolase family 88 protein n=1 Tax=Silvibacterium dinghuense TaxID=1560006 RepID=A0A4Q1S9V2_9BACT|nr:glycoside hydrolase family 88 protein [Silvibacterium dinghuense]RXS93705.1 glycoside hydrolase family 88 protein [Silvibacterium dinghuense]